MAGRFAWQRPGAGFTVSGALNNRGDIVGWYTLPAAPAVRHGFLLRDGEFTTFDPPGSIFTNVLGINDRGDIVGRSCTRTIVGKYCRHRVRSPLDPTLAGIEPSISGLSISATFVRRRGKEATRDPVGLHHVQPSGENHQCATCSS
jgi:hypothetical protein